MTFNTYIIRLKGNQLSEQLAKDVFQSSLKFNFNPIYFDAIDKSKALDFISSENLILAKDKKMKASLGTIGCFCSHYSLWKIASKQDKPIIILEHDGVIINDFKTIINQIQDVCHLDPNDPYSFNYDESVSKVKDLKVEYYQRAELKQKRITGGYFRGAYGYILTPYGATKLINFVREKGCFTADRSICERAVFLTQTSYTCVRLHSFFDSAKKIKDYSTRD